MEIIKTKEVSNHAYISNLCKGRKVLNGFNKLEEVILGEDIMTSTYKCQNVFFDRMIEGDLYISYPLSVVVKETIKFSSLYDLIQSIRKVYKKIYKLEKSNTRMFGIWGHSI